MCLQYIGFLCDIQLVTLQTSPAVTLECPRLKVPKNLSHCHVAAAHPAAAHLPPNLCCGLDGNFEGPLCLISTAQSCWLQGAAAVIANASEEGSCTEPASVVYEDSVLCAC